MKRCVYIHMSVCNACLCMCLHTSILNTDTLKNKLKFVDIHIGICTIVTILHMYGWKM